MRKCWVGHTCSSLIIFMICVVRLKAWHSSIRATARHLIVCRYGSSSSVSAAQESFHVLANQKRSWQRLQHVVNMAIEHSPKGSIVADIGTDHGLVVFGLGLSGHFGKAIGVDVSEKALSAGALRLLDYVQQYRNQQGNKERVPVEFRVGDGLQALGRELGRVDTVCLAGMGVPATLNILSSRKNGESKRHLDELQVNNLVLQPINARPGNLMLLYSSLSEMGWTAKEERIEYLSSRWYITSLFQRNNDTESSQLPGEILEGCQEKTETFLAYVKHHVNWIDMNHKSSGGKFCHQPDMEWKARFLHLIENENKNVE